MKRIVGILWEKADSTWFYKDMCAYLYYLAKYYGWQAVLCYYPKGDLLENKEYEKSVTLKSLGYTESYNEQLRIAKKFILHNSNDIDVIMMFNYGGNTYKLANYVKTINPNITIWSKLDMSESGFSHFYDGTILRQLKNIVELWKSRNVDIFTVENYTYYKTLKKLNVFKNRVEYLPNGVSVYDLDIDNLDSKDKENVIVYIGRLDAVEKNAELFLDALAKIDEDVLMKWEVRIIGPYAEDIQNKYDAIVAKNNTFKNKVHLLGKITDRNIIYEICSRARIICLTSLSESFGIAVIEGMYWGAYPIITNYGRIVEDITDNRKLGVVVDSNDSCQYARALQSVMKSGVAQVVSQKCKDYVRTRFGYINLTAKLDKILLNL